MQIKIGCFPGKRYAMDNIGYNDLFLNRYIKGKYSDFDFDKKIGNIPQCKTLILHLEPMRRMMRPTFNSAYNYKDLPIQSLIINNHYEGNHSLNLLNNCVRSWSSATSVPVKVITQNQSAATRIEEVEYLNRVWKTLGTFNMPCGDLWYTNQFTVSDTPGSIFNYIFGVPREDKILMFKSLYESNIFDPGVGHYLASGGISVYNGINYWKHIKTSDVQKYMDTLTNVKLPANKTGMIEYDDVVSKIPVRMMKQSRYNQLSYDDKIMAINVVYTIYNSEISIVQESEMTSHTNRYTEKSMKPIQFKQPFIIAGNYKVLELLRLDGFKTFHPYINENYDTLSDTSDRISAITSECLRLARMTEGERRELLKQLEPIVKHNTDHMNTLNHKYKIDINNIIAKTL